MLFPYALIVDRKLMQKPSIAGYRNTGTAARIPPLLWSTLLILVAVIVLFSQTWAWYADEGYHLLASQLINSGQKPYVDFFYPQTPLYAYLNAGWMSVFGQTWRTSHLLSALATSGSIILAAGFVFERVPENAWKLSAAIVVAILMGMNTIVLEFGTISQPYGFCLFLIMAAFRLAINGVSEMKPVLLLCSGLCAGVSAGSSLLSAPVLPVLLTWTARRSLKPCIWFLIGLGISFLPLVWLAMLAPWQMIFNVLEYHFFYRSIGIGKTIVSHNIDILAGLLRSRQFLLQIVFAGIGVLFVVGRSECDAGRKAEFYLCSSLAATLTIVFVTLPVTFTQYFILVIPFLSILAAIGIIATATWLRVPRRPAWLVPGMLGLFVVGTPWWLWQQSRSFHWSQLEAVAKVINEVTPKDGLIWGVHESIYFAAKRAPLPGLERLDAQKLPISPEDAANLHIYIMSSTHRSPYNMSSTDLQHWIASGRFATIASCWGLATDAWIDMNGIRKVYTKRTTIDGCDVFWSHIFHKVNPTPNFDSSR
jgi:hypothetical protein